MSARSSPLGSGLYFIDVLACLLFCLALALVNARFGAERSVAIEVPAGEPAREPGAALSGWRIRVEGTGPAARVFVDDQELSVPELQAKLYASPPPAVVLYSDASPLARIMASAHAAGVRDVELAYESEEQTP